MHNCSLLPGTEFFWKGALKKLLWSNGLSEHDIVFLVSAPAVSCFSWAAAELLPDGRAKEERSLFWHKQSWPQFQVIPFHSNTISAVLLSRRIDCLWWYLVANHSNASGWFYWWEMFSFRRLIAAEGKTNNFVMSRRTKNDTLPEQRVISKLWHEATL